MPITTSAEKALRQSKRRHARNTKQKTETRAALKEYKKLLSAAKKEEAREKLSLVYKKLDKLAKTKVIQKGKANRLKSRLARKLLK